MTDYGFAPTERMLTPATLAEMLGISERHLTDLRNEDPTFPQPVWLGKLPRWSPAVIRRWMDRPATDGCTCVHGKATDTAPATPDKQGPKKGKRAQRVH